jgi:uncharacterized protein (DUF2126 family)
MRPERMYLIPGDSPIGFRLPLDSLPWVKSGDYPYLHPQDPMEARGPLPPRQAFVQGVVPARSQARREDLPRNQGWDARGRRSRGAGRR